MSDKPLRESGYYWIRELHNGTRFISYWCGWEWSCPSEYKDEEDPGYKDEEVRVLSKEPLDCPYEEGYCIECDVSFENYPELKNSDSEWCRTCTKKDPV